MKQNKIVLVLVFALFSSIFLMSACNIGVKQSTLQCNKPYIQKGTDCCLDNNNNFVCDSDENIQRTIVAQDVKPDIESLIPRKTYGNGACSLIDFETPDNKILSEDEKQSIEEINEKYSITNYVYAKYGDSGFDDNKNRNCDFQLTLTIAEMSDFTSGTSNLINDFYVLKQSDENARLEKSYYKDVTIYEVYSSSRSQTINLHKSVLFAVKPYIFVINTDSWQSDALEEMTKEIIDKVKN